MYSCLSPLCSRTPMEAVRLLALLRTFERVKYTRPKKIPFVYANRFGTTHGEAKTLSTRSVQNP